MISEHFNIKAQVETELYQSKLEWYMENDRPVIGSVSNTISTEGQSGKKKEGI